MHKKDGTAYTIAVAGIGYVGLSMAILLSQYNRVIATDINQNKVDLLNRRISAIDDKEIREFLQEKDLNLTATTNALEAYAAADYILICTPTNYDCEKESFDTSSIESVLRETFAVNPAAVAVIKSTVPIGYTRQMAKRYPDCRILFSPEFLREGRALYDNLHPSRIIVGNSACGEDHLEAAQTFAALLREASLDENVPALFPRSGEAEAIKLFSNTYLAMRIAFFNELDSFAEAKGLESNSIIEGIGLDSRIGMNYNNPSFGYGGYCLPKDTKQLLSSYGNIPQSMMSAVVESNVLRKRYIAENILRKAIERVQGKRRAVIGVYRLAMKAGSDNLRSSALCDIVKYLHESGAVDILIYEDKIPVELVHEDVRLTKDLKELKEQADLIVANRCGSELEDVSHKLYSRDIYNRD